jgi:hypothetical protein
MSIESAQYYTDITGKTMGIAVVNDGITSYLDESGATWLHVELQEWIAAGNEVSPAAAPVD